MSLVERAREVKRRRQAIEDPSHRRLELERIYRYSLELLEEAGTRIDSMQLFSILINDPADKPGVEVKISRKMGTEFLRLEVEDLDESLTVEKTGEVKNSQMQFKAYLTRPFSGYSIREASIEDVNEYSELIYRVRSQRKLAVQTPRHYRASSVT